MSFEQKSIEHAKEIGDIGAGVVTVAAIMEYAPAVAAVFTALYAVFRLFEGIEKYLYERKQRALKGK